MPPKFYTPMNTPPTWPDSPASRTQFFITYQVSILEALNVHFDIFDFDPIEISQQFLKGEIAVSEMQERQEQVWKWLEAQNLAFDVNNKQSAKARLALGVLTTENSDLDYLNEALDWFFVFLRTIGYSQKQIALARTALK